MMPRRRPAISGPDCTCPECCAAARMARLILIGSAAAWALIAAAILALFI